MDTRMRVLFGFLLICNTLLMLFLISLVLQTRVDVANLETRLATKADLLNVRAPRTDDVLEKNCGRCHSETRFTGYHGSEEDLLAMIAEMQGLSGAPISPKDVDKIHASLELLECNSCHEQARLRSLALKSGEEQKGIIREMLMKSNGVAVTEEVERLHRSYQELYGF